MTTTYREAMRAALRDALTRDERVFLMGEDVGRYGGCLAVSFGLLDEFGPEGIRDTPLSESAFVGAGIGAALGVIESLLVDAGCEVAVATPLARIAPTAAPVEAPSLRPDTRPAPPAQAAPRPAKRSAHRVASGRSKPLPSASAPRPWRAGWPPGAAPTSPP